MKDCEPQILGHTADVRHACLEWGIQDGIEILEQNSLTDLIDNKGFPCSRELYSTHGTG